MADFGTEAVFEATVSESSLRDVRDTVEDQLGDIEVQVTAQTNVGGGGQASKERAMGRQLQSAQVDALTEIQTSLAEPDVAPAILDEWDRQHDLSEERNWLLEQLLNAQQQQNFNKATRVGGAFGAGVMGALILGGVAAGKLISFLSGFEFDIPDIPPILPPGQPGWVPIDVLDPDWLPVGVPQPDWTPLDILEPDWLPITIDGPDKSPTGDGTGTGTPDDSPTGTSDGTPTGTPGDHPVPVPPTAPTGRPDGDQTPWPTNGPRPVPVGTGPLPETDPTPTPSPTGDGTEWWEIGSIIAAGSAAVGAASKFLKGATSGLIGSGTASGIGFPTLVPFVAEHGNEIWDFLPDFGGGPGVAMSTGVAWRAAQQSDGRRDQQKVVVNNNPTYQVDTGDLRDLKRQQQRNRRELERKLKDIKRQFDGPGGTSSRL